MDTRAARVTRSSPDGLERRPMRRDGPRQVQRGGHHPGFTHCQGGCVYLWLKLAHIVAVIAFFGNIATGLFWHAHAARTRDPRILAHIMEGIIRSDRLFTIPGVLGIIATGFGAAIVGGLPILGTGWILWTIVLFTISGVVFVARVAPLQRALLAFAAEGGRSAVFDYAGYHRLARRWEYWGAVALLTPLAGLVLMVLKPGF